MIKHQTLLIEQVDTEILQMRSKLRLLLTNMCKFCWKNAGSIPTRGNIFFLSFITQIYTILPDLTEYGSRPKTRVGTLKHCSRTKLTPKNHNVFFQNEVIFVQLDKLDELDSITHAQIEFNFSLK